MTSKVDTKSSELVAIFHDLLGSSLFYLFVRSVRFKRLVLTSYQRHLTALRTPHLLFVEYSGLLLNIR
jgi:hypothetical protein